VDWFECVDFAFCISMQVQSARTVPRVWPVFVLFTCLLMFPLSALCGAGVATFFGDRAGRELYQLMAMGVFGAQLSMLAIWLCLLATSLYWCLTAIAALVVLLLALAPAVAGAPSASLLVTGGFTATIPLAVMNVAGFRLAPSEAIVAGVCADPPRYSLRSLFFWTFIVAATLALFQWLPATLVQRLEFVLSLLAISAVAVATLWAVLRAGSIWLRLVCAPTALLLVAAIATQKLLGWHESAVPRLLGSGVVYIMALAGLLAIYRRAGLRLVHRTAGGWLVR
jgi:hypothetical protein